MKISAFLLFCCLVNIFAAPTYSQVTKISLNFKDATIEEVLSKIEDVSEFYFLYNNKLIDVTRKVNIEADKEPIKDILNDILNKDTKFVVYDRQIILTQSDVTGLSAKMQQQLKITGTVTDKDGAPLPGVNVVVTGTIQGVITDIDGKYSIEVPQGSKSLKFTFIGMQPQEITIGTLTQIDVTMAESAIGLDEVVVIGYGTQKKRDITGSIASISTEDIALSPISNTTQILQGRVAGVMVTSESGSPGAGVNVRIRGLGTVNDNGPLYVIDGMPFNNMNNLNPADIESIEILKDASASAIYGARAANGVVLVTTKRGTTGETKIIFESYIGVSSAWKDPVQLNSDEYYDMIKTAHQNGGTSVPANLESEYQNGYDTNWWDEYTQQGIIQNYFLSVSGGTEKVKYALSGGYYKQEGLIIGSDYSRYSFRSNTDINISKRIKAGINLGITNSLRNVISESARWSFGLISEGINMDPMVPVINPNADVNDPNYEFNKFGFTSVTDAYNPVALAARTFNPSKNFRTSGNAYIDFTIIDGLIFRSNFGLDLNNSNGYAFNPSFFMAAWEQRSYNSVSRNYSEGIGFVWENMLTYTAKIDEKHSLTAMVASTSEEYKYEGFSGSKRDIPFNDETFRVLEAATTSDQITGTKNSNALLSYFARINYAFKDKYLLTATYRLDGSSRFADGKNWGKFPSTSIGWRLSEENFFKNLNARFINNIKIRLGWGQIGNQNIANYAYLSLINGGNSRRYTIGDVPLQGYSSSSIGNPDIQWETVEQTNIALDINLFENKLSISTDYYVKNTKDMLLNVPLPYYSGYPASPWSNAGAVKNEGVEIQANYRNSISDFSYEVGLNFTTIKNEVVSLGSGGAIFGGQSRIGLVTKTEVGQPIGSFFGFVMDGIFQNENEVAKGAQPQANPGDIRFKDIAGTPDDEGNPTGPDGIINEYDRTYLGSPIPDFLLGFNCSLKYKNIDFSIFFQGAFGNEVYSFLKYWTYAPTGYFNVSKEAYDNAWRGEGTSNIQPIISSNTGSDNYRNSSFYVEDGSYLRIKNLQLGYTLPQSASKVLFLSELRVYISAQNFFTFTKYSGLDPELGSGTLLDVGVDYGGYPQARTLMAGVNVTF
ncbi:MAG TPA: TonB-dependent receptor [Bacteroidales bacterium]|nr:TonB-dependent receptor [Bacteroidales bacterium]